jgi:hypothetical protein
MVARATKNVVFAMNGETFRYDVEIGIFLPVHIIQLTRNVKEQTVKLC